MRSHRPTSPGLAPTQPPVPATEAAAARAMVADAQNSQIAPLSAPSEPSSPTRVHPSLTALARLLARQIGRSEGENG